MIRLRSETRLCLILVATLLAVARAHAQSAAQAVDELNRQAMEAYQALDINRAGSTLEQALGVAQQGGVPPQLVARTNLYLGVVYVGGLNDQNSGLNYFVQALCIDANVQLDPLSSTPEVLSVFNVAMQRARSGACQGGGGPMPMGQPQYGPPQPVAPPPPPPPPSPDQAFSHTPPAEQLSQTPLPIYAEISPLAQAKKITLYYKALGMDKFKAVPMYRYQSGFAFQISCNDVWEPKVTYYIEAKSADGRIVGVFGTAGQPIDVSVVSARRAAEPSLPGSQPPITCVAKECPPGVQGCKKEAKAGIDESCSGDSSCQSGLECRDGKCALIGAGGTDVPAYNPITGTYDEGSMSESSKPSGPVRDTYVQLGFAVGLAYVQAGMIADRSPPDSSHIFIDPSTGAFIADPQTAYMTGTPAALVLPRPGMAPDAALGPWVPDADSGDSLGLLQSTCGKDGKVTGPMVAPTGASLFPSRYCVRVRSPGFVPNPALRAAVGHFFWPRIALAALFRFQFAGGMGTLSHMLLGARAEYMFTERKSNGFMASGFAGGTFGEIQAQPSAQRTNGAPYVKSGLMGLHAGATFRYAFSSRFSLFAAPELDIQLPTFLINIDLTLAGAEVDF